MLQKFRHCLVGILILHGLGHASTGVVSPVPGDREINLGPVVEILEDPEGTLTLEQVAGPFAERFRPHQGANPSFGFTTSTYWLRFRLDLGALSSGRWYLVQRHPIIDHLTLYGPRANGGWTAWTMGDARPFGERLLDHREFIFPLDDFPEGPATWYLKVAGKGALSLELKLSSAEGLIERTYREQLIFGLFYGALVVMLVYNLLLYFSVRDVAYLWYILFLVNFILCFVNINGLGLQYLWPDHPGLNEWYPVFAVAGMLALLCYSRAFLDLASQFPRYERWLRRQTWAFLAALVLVLVLPAPWSYHLSTLVVLVTVLSLTWIGFGTWRRGYRAARLYVAAWSVFLVGCLVFFLDNARIIPHTDWSNYAPHIGSAWVAVLLSLALGERIKLLEAERDALELQAREALERHLEEVQRLDRDKMVFLGYLSHELNTPLNWLASARELEAGRLPPDLSQAVSMVHKGQDRLQRLVAVSLRYFDLASREQAQPVSRVAPMWKLDRILRDGERAALLEARQIRVRNRIPAELVMEGNERELGQVLEMLLDNAIQFSPDESEILALGEVDGDGAVLRICDQGKGILEDDLKGIFEPFYMVGSGHHVEGFGLSLPMARVMIEQMGGRIWAESAGRGKGTCLCIRLPLAED